MSRHWRDAAERWNERIQKHALAGHPATVMPEQSYPAGTKDRCDFCDWCRKFFSRAVDHLAQRPKHLKEAERA